jgi:serine/threonine protein kinase
VVRINKQTNKRNKGILINSLFFSALDYLLILEYADGGTLENYLKKHFSELEWDTKFNLALQLANALLCLHENGIIHCDLVSLSNLQIIFATS